MSSIPPAGPIKSGRQRSRALLNRTADYDWAERAANWWSPDGRQDVTLSVSRSPGSIHAEGTSVAIFLGDPADLTIPGAQLSEDEFRDLLVAAGFSWARP